MYESDESEPDQRGLDRQHGWDSIVAARRRESKAMWIALLVVLGGTILMAIYLGASW